MAAKAGHERRVFRYLMDRGEPTDTGTIAEALGVDRRVVIRAIQRRKDVFVRAGKIKREGKLGGGISYLWAAWEE